MNHDADPDLGSVALLAPGSGMGKKSGSESWMSKKYFRELRNKFLGLKYLNYLMRIRDEKKFGSGMEKSSFPGFGMEKIRNKMAAFLSPA
jgi:hypothetical protein